MTVANYNRQKLPGDPALLFGGIRPPCPPRAATPKTWKSDFRQVFLKNNAIFFKKVLALFFAGLYSAVIMTTQSVIAGQFVGAGCPGVPRLHSDGGKTAFYLVKTD
jgi:hypothetical protein